LSFASGWISVVLFASEFASAKGVFLLGNWMGTLSLDRIVRFPGVVNHAGYQDVQTGFFITG
jgi:hypothetical protein